MFNNILDDIKVNVKMLIYNYIPNIIYSEYKYYANPRNIKILFSDLFRYLSVALPNNSASGKQPKFRLIH